MVIFSKLTEEFAWWLQMQKKVACGLGVSGLFCPKFAFFVVFSFTGVFSPLGAESGLDELLRDAYANNPQLKAAHERWAAALERVPQARSLPDPTMSYGYFVERMDTRQTFRVEQMLPGWGQRSLRADIARDGAQVAADALEIIAADIRRDLMQAVASWVLARESTALVQKNLERVQSLEEVALQRYRSGDVSQADVLRLQMEAEYLQVDLQQWQDRQSATHAAINAIRGREVYYPLPEIKTLPEVRSDPPVTNRGGESVRYNPDLVQEQSRIQEAQRSQALAAISRRPNIMLGVEYMDNRGMAPDEVMAMVGISIPLWQNRYRAERREAAANLRAVEWDYQARYQRTQADLQMAVFEWQDAKRRVELFETSLIPRARQALAILEADYRTGRSGFLDLLNAQRALLELDLALLQAKNEEFIRMAQWERLSRNPEFNRYR